MTTSSDRWRRIEALFEAVHALPPGERAAVLDREGAEGDLRAEVETLLDAHDEAGGFLMGDDCVAGDGRLADGDRLGPYRIAGVLGQGGMGTVYRGVRDDGQFERAVALKVLRAGHGNVPRFLNERQILARLDHPGIARLYDGGVTAEGQPYFALELVDGEPITVAAERRAMSVEQRLKLFGDVCGAVAYAHQRLVVHRDLKPSNVFVTEDGEVRLLDFGIAKLLDAAEADLTTTGAAPRTPAYAAPEQIRGEPVTTATDVYALGVLLYELLTGKRPYALDERARAAIERAILHTEPTVPSDAVTQTASGSATAAPAAPDRLAKRLRGDLDQIVLKALRKEPAARYGSAEAFAADIARHLAGDVVEARPLGVLYRMRRLARRHRAVLGVAVLGVALLVGWAVTATVQGQRVAAERDRAEALNRVLVDLFESVDPTTGGDRGLTVSEFLSSATDRLQRDLTERPALQAELLSVLAASHLGLGDHTAADSVASLAASAAASLPPGHRARTLARSWYAWTRTYHGDYETSEQIYRSLLTEATTQDLPTVETDFAMVLAEMGNEDEALAMYQQAVGSLRPLSRRDSTRRRDLASALDGLSTLYASRWTAEGYERAWSLQDEAVRIKSEVWGAGHPQTAEAVSELAGLAAARNDLPTADSLFARSVGLLEAAYGSEHPTVATVLNNWALARANGGDHDGSEPLHLRALAVREAVYGEQHQSTAASIQNLAALYSLMPGREADALALYERAQRAYDASLPDGHYLRAFPVAGRANVLRQLGRSADAVREARRAVDLLAESLGPDHTATIETRGTLGLALASMGRDAEAEEHLRAALARDPDDETRRRLVSALRGR